MHRDDSQRDIVKKKPVFVAATAGIKAAAKRVVGRDKKKTVKVK